jgi:hypothetical protein
VVAVEVTDARNGAVHYWSLAKLRSDFQKYCFDPSALEFSCTLSISLMKIAVPAGKKLCAVGLAFLRKQSA